MAADAIYISVQNHIQDQKSFIVSISISHTYVGIVHKELSVDRSRYHQGHQVSWQ